MEAEGLGACKVRAQERLRISQGRENEETRRDSLFLFFSLLLSTTSFTPLFAAFPFPFFSFCGLLSRS